MNQHYRMGRRQFLKLAARAGGTAWVMRYLPSESPAQAGPIPTRSQVSLTAGDDHVDLIFQGLQRFKQPIAAAIGNRPILVKPNCVIGTPDNDHGDVLLSDTPVESLEAILEFLKSIGKTDVTIAESCATDPTMVAFENCDYFSLSRKYAVRFKDLNEEGYELVAIYSGGRSVTRPTQTIRISKLLVNPDYFVISAAKTKTHNNVIATLSLKCVAMAAPIVDVGYFRNVANCRADKPSMHGSGNQDLHDNLHLLARRLAPDLAVIDGYTGMQGNGPCWGTAVNQKVGIVSLDWLAADRVGVELMGISSAYPAYLNYCHQTRLGQYDLSQIDVWGERIADHRVAYQPNNNWSGQLGMNTEART